MYLFIYFWLRWVFVAACRLSLVAASGGYSLRCAGFSLRWLLLLWSMGSRRAASEVMARRLSSCGARSLLLRGRWVLPGPGIKPVCPALAGGFLTTATPGKSLLLFSCLTSSRYYVNEAGMKGWGEAFLLLCQCTITELIILQKINFSRLG